MILGFIFITNQINCYIFYTAAVNGLGIKLSKDKVKPEGSQLSPCYQYQAIFIKDRFLVNGDILPATVLSNKENKSTSLNVRLLCSLFDFKKMALPQIEWVNISIEPANTPLSVIPASAGMTGVYQVHHLLIKV